MIEHLTSFPTASPISATAEISANSLKNEPLSNLISLVTLAGASQSSVGVAQVEFQRRYTSRFNKLLKGLKGIRSPERLLHEMFQDFYAHVAKTGILAKSELDEVVRRGLTEVLLQIVSTTTLAGLLRRLSKDAAMLELCSQELNRRFYRQLKDSVQNWERISPGLNFDAIIAASFQNVLDKNLLKNLSPRQSADWNFLEILKSELVHQAPLDALIILMKNPDVDPPMVERVYTEFYNRYLPRIKQLWKKWKHFGSRYDVEFYTSECFQKFYLEVIPKLKMPKDGDPNVLAAIVWVILERMFSNKAMTNRLLHNRNVCEENGGIKAIQKLYGFRGEHNEFRKHRKKSETQPSGEPKINKKDRELVDALERLALIQQSKDWETHVEGFKSMLSPESRKIMVASSKYYNVFNGRCEMPEQIVTPLCKNLKITPQTLASQRSRLLKKLRAFIRSVNIELLILDPPKKKDAASVEERPQEVQ